MKKIVLLCVAFSYAYATQAQKYEEIKVLASSLGYKKGKELLDKNWANPKFTAKPEAYILKATILAGLATDSSMASQKMSLYDEALGAFDKYKEMDPAKSLISEKSSTYYNTAAIIYGGYFNEGIGNYNEKKWEDAFKNFAKAVSISDFLVANHLTDMKLDTNGILLAGAAAQSLKNDDEAAKYFTKLADGKVGGKENEFLYHFLAGYYMQKGDVAGFNKYINLGKEVYAPNNASFNYTDVGYILQMPDGPKRDELIGKKLEQDPSNFELQSVVGEAIFGKLNPKDADTPMPENYDALEARMVAAFTKSVELQPKNGLAFTNLANHFMNKSVKISKMREELVAQIRDKNAAAKTTTPKPGVKHKSAPVDPADAAKKEELKAKYNGALVKAGEYYEKAADIFSKNTEPKAIEKQQYRNAVSYLIDINREFKDNSKATPAIYDKYEKLEKKWSDIYSKL